MADEEQGLTYLLKTILNAKGFEDLQAHLKQAEENSKGAAGSTSEFSEAIQGLAAPLVGMAAGILSVGEAVSFMKSALAEAVEESRILDQMRAANESLGHATAESREQNEAWIRSVEMASGKTKEELIPGYLRLVAVTGDVSQAQRLTQIAAGAAAQGYGEVGAATQALIKYYETGKAPIKGFGAVITGLTKDVKDQGEGFARLERQFGEAGKGVDNLGLKVDRAKIGWKETKEAIGGLATGLLDYLAPAMKAAAMGIGGLISFVNYLITPMKMAGSVIGSVATAIGALIALDFKGATQAIAEIPGKMVKIAADAVDFNVKLMGKIEKVWSGTAEALNKDTTKITGAAKKQKDAIKELEDKYKDLMTQAKLYSVSQYDALTKEIALLKLMAAEPAFDQKKRNEILLQVKEAEKKLNDEIQKGNEILAKKGKTLKQVQEEFDKEQEAERKKAEQTADHIAKKEIEKWKKIHKSDKDYEAAYIAMLKRILAAWNGSKEEEENIAAEVAGKEIELAKKVAAEKLATAFQVANATVALAGEVFGQSKGVAIAQAVINTAQGVTAALATTPPASYVMAALTAALGLAQIMKIADTDVGAKAGTSSSSKGFDNPNNDYAAYMGGQKWAQDMIEQWTGGVGQGFNDGMAKGGRGSAAPHVTNITSRGGDRHSIVHVNVSGPFDASNDVAARRLVKAISPYLYNRDKQRNLR